MKKFILFSLIILFSSWNANPAFSQTVFPDVVDLGRSYDIPLGGNDSVYIITFKNKTGLPMENLEIEADPRQGDTSDYEPLYKITRAKITSTQEGGAGDWDVDVDGNGNSQDSAEKGNNLPTPIQSVHIDCRGDGTNSNGQNEQGSESEEGQPIENDSEFTLEIEFSSAIDNPLIFVCPSIAFSNHQVDSQNWISETYTYHYYEIQNRTSINPGLTCAGLNCMLDPITKLLIQTTGDYTLEECREYMHPHSPPSHYVDCDHATEFEYSLWADAMPMPSDPEGMSIVDFLTFNAAVDLGFSNLSSGYYTTCTITPVTASLGIYSPIVEVPAGTEEVTCTVYACGSGLVDVTSGDCGIFYDSHLVLKSVTPSKYMSSQTFQYTTGTNTVHIEECDVDPTEWANAVSDNHIPICDVEFDIPSGSQMKKANTMADSLLCIVAITGTFNNGSIYPAQCPGAVVITSPDTDVEDETHPDGITPEHFALHQNYPNPFNASTSISFTLKESRFVTLKIFDVSGRELHTLVEEMKKPGDYTVEWDAGDLPSGTYLAKLAVGDRVETRKLILQR